MWPLRQFKNAQGLRIAYRDQPENIGKPAILCLHGLTRNSLDFSDLADHLGADFRVLAMDVRGRGRSDRDPDPQNYHPGSYVEDTLMLLDDAGLDEVILIGTSMGGLMSMIMGAQIKDRIKPSSSMISARKSTPRGSTAFAAMWGPVPLPEAGPKTGMKPGQRCRRSMAMPCPALMRRPGIASPAICVLKRILGSSPIMTLRLPMPCKAARPCRPIYGPYGRGWMAFPF